MISGQETNVTLVEDINTTDKGVEFTQEADWVNLSRLEPEEGVTVLLATESSIAIGHLSEKGGINIEFMPWGQEEDEDDELEFTHWMYLPAAPCWLRALHSHIKVCPAKQLSLWS